MHIFTWSSNPYTPKCRRSPMVTPVHGLQGIEYILSEPHNRFTRCDPGRQRGRRWFLRPSISRTRQRAERRRAQRLHRRMMRHRGPPSGLETTELSTVTTAHVDLLGAQPDPPPQNFNRFNMTRLKWFVLAFIIVAIALLVPAHLFLQKFPLNIEIIAVAFTLVLIFIIGFSVTMFHTRTRDILMHRYEMENRMQRDHEAAQISLNDPQQQFIANQLRLRRNRHIIRFRSTRSTPDLFQNGDTRHLRSAYGRRHGFAGRTPRSLSHNSRTTVRNAAHIPYGQTRSDPSIRGLRNGEPPPYEVALNFPSTFSAEEDSTETPPPSYDAI